MSEFDDAPFHPPGSSGPPVDGPTDPFGQDATQPYGTSPRSDRGSSPAYGAPAGGTVPFGSPGPAPGGAPGGYGQPGYGDGSGYSYGVGYGGYGSGYGYGPSGYGYPAYAPGPRNETMAVLSLIFSILSWFLCLFYGLGIVASVAGVILGFLSRRKIRDSDGLFTGEGMALAGIIVGLVNIAFFVGAIVLIVVAVIASN